MLNPQTVSSYVLPPPAVFRGANSVSGNRSPADRFGRLAVLADTGAKARAKLKEQSDRFDELYREADRTAATPEELVAAAEIILANERKAAEVLAPQIEKLQQHLTRKHPSTDFARSVRRLAEDALEVGQTWLELYQNLRMRLLKLASDRRAAAGESGSPILSDAAEMERYLRRVAGE
jgi:hypothetical protein